MKKSLFLALTVLAAAVLFAACVQMPTEKSSVADLRPQLSFRVIGDASAMHVFVDGLDMGKVSNYLEGGESGGGQALRVLSGSHVIKVMKGDAAIHEEKLYLGDGVSKTILVD